MLHGTNGIFIYLHLALMILKCMVSADKYSIHGASGMCLFAFLVWLAGRVNTCRYDVYNMIIYIYMYDCVHMPIFS